MYSNQKEKRDTEYKCYKEDDTDNNISDRKVLIFSPFSNHKSKLIPFFFIDYLLHDNSRDLNHPKNADLDSYNKPYKPPNIMFPDTIINPSTMMVILRNTSPTNMTMMFSCPHLTDAKKT